MAINYASVVAQLHAFGLDVSAIATDGKAHRCKYDGSRDDKGWYLLHEVTLSGGDTAIVGSYGVWQGNNNNAQKLAMDLPDLTPEQAKAFRDQVKSDRKAVEMQRAGEAKRAAARAAAMWKHLPESGDSEYLTRKQVTGHGVRYTPSGSVVVPMTDNAGAIHGLQFILARDGKNARRIKRLGRDKEFWPKGHQMKGFYHLIGLPSWVCLVTEGEATGASLHEATTLPVAVAFTAGNIGPVVRNLQKRFPRTKFLICADDDRFGKCLHEIEPAPNHSLCKNPIDLTAGDECQKCGNPHKARNTGCDAAAAVIGDGIQWIKPEFSDQAARAKAFFDNGAKLSDFNDLHVTEGLNTVRDQVDAALRRFGWNVPSKPSRDTQIQGSGDSNGRRAAVSTLPVDEIVERFVYVDDNTGDFVFDRWTKEVVRKGKVVSLLPPHVRWESIKDTEQWRSNAVYIDQIGFDPAGEDSNIVCNRWAGWPTEPKAGECGRLLELLQYLSSGERNAAEVFRWMQCWLAYPIQHPGAKMHSAMVVHGPQGTGKSRFFESYARIFGDYSIVLNQGAIEDKFNADWTERKLFVVADEIVARQEMHHLKNQLKNLITGEWVRVNPKNVAAHRERNHMNIVFLSNEKLPVVLENDDRRHLVMWTPPPLSQAFFDELDAEISAGGVAALHHHLLTLDLGDFKPWTRPPMTRSKQQLIDVNQESVDRFLLDWQSGDIEWLPFCPCASSDLYSAYLKWSRAEGVRFPREANQFGGHIDKLSGWFKGHKDRYDGTNYQGRPKRQRMVVPPDDLLRAQPWSTEVNPHGNAQPSGKTQTEWLTDSFWQFRNALYGDAL